MSKHFQILYLHKYSLIFIRFLYIRTLTIMIYSMIVMYLASSNLFSPVMLETDLHYIIILTTDQSNGSKEIICCTSQFHHTTLEFVLCSVVTNPTRIKAPSVTKGPSTLIHLHSMKCPHCHIMYCMFVEAS